LSIPGRGGEKVKFRTRNLFFLWGLLLAAAQVPGYALDVPTRAIQDDSSLRILLRDTWFTEVPGKVLTRPPVLHTLPGGDRVRIWAENGPEELTVVLAREINGTFPGWAQGSWRLTRRRDTGAPDRIQVFLRSDPAAYVQFRPLTPDKSLMDVVLYDAYVARSKPLGLPFDRLLTAPLEDVLDIAGDTFPRRYFEPDPEMYRDARAFIGRLRQRLPEVRYRDDGALDEDGRYVFIETLQEQDGPGGLNCSGFAKWVVDGILRPLTGERLTVPPLKAPFGDRGSSLTGVYEQVRDPFFGLDWTRNLAAAAGSVLRGSAAFGALEEIEVRKGSFTSLILRSRQGASPRSYPDFLRNAGFGSEGIQPLLYTLAVDEPGHIYLASISTEQGPAPRMRRHFHVAVLVPYFSETGIFRVALFESAEETSFVNFKSRYPGHQINLVRVPVEGAFDP
jgi:hypothetical protein